MSTLPKVSRVTSYAKTFTTALEDEFKKRTNRVAERVRQKLRENLSTAGAGTPSKPGEYSRSQSGAMVRGIKTVITRRSPYTVRIVNRAAHNAAQEFGTSGGQMITPKRANVLAFPMGKGGKKSGTGGTVFTKRVKRGAIKPRANERRTLESLREVIRAIYTRGIPEFKGKNKAIVRIG
jgi:hypothetical protein